MSEKPGEVTVVLSRDEAECLYEDSLHRSGQVVAGKLREALAAHDAAQNPLGLPWEALHTGLWTDLARNHSGHGPWVSCNECAFTYSAEHFTEDGKYGCPLCEATRYEKALEEIAAWEPLGIEGIGTCRTIARRALAGGDDD